MSNQYWEVRQRDKVFNAALGVAERQLSQVYSNCLLATEKKLSELYDEINEAKEDGTLLISDLYKYNRYYELMNVLNAELTKTGKQENKIIDNVLTAFYITNTQLIADEIGLYKNSGIFVDEASVKTAINTIWCQDGKHWSSRIWGNKSALQKRVEKGIVDCVARGTTKNELIAELRKNINIGFYEADRLVRTEMNYIQNQAAFDKYKEAGIEKYKYLAYLDKRTSEVCENLNGKVFRLDEAKVGVNYPPLHPNCRSTVLAVI